MPDVDAYDYDLPRELIAQEPLADRSSARMLVVCRSDGALAHRSVRDLVELLHPGDLLVVNDTRVVPARLEGRREQTGGRWEGLWLESPADGVWRLLAHTRGRVAIGERIVLVDADGADRFTLEMTGRGPGGTWLAHPDQAGTVEQLLGAVGRVPLPGYIRGGDARADDLPRYQTVFARLAGSAAAPTAGLHFTPALLAALADRGIGMARVTLHVGIDTFRPIAVDNRCTANGATARRRRWPPSPRPGPAGAESSPWGRPRCGRSRRLPRPERLPPGRVRHRSSSAPATSSGPSTAC